MKMFRLSRVLHSAIILPTLLVTLIWPSLAYAQENRASTLNFPYYDATPEATSGCGGGSLTGGDNPEKTWNYLIGKGFTAIQAAGAMGNLQHEGRFEPRQLEIAYSDPPHLSDTVPPNIGPAGQPGYGIVQWTSPSRKQGLVDFSAADSSKRAVNDLSLQLDYMWSELEGPYKVRVLDPLMKATELGEAVSIWQDKYEVGTLFGPRLKAAQEWLAKYGSGVSVSGNATGCQLDASGCPTSPISQSETVLAGDIRVHPCIAPEVERILALAKQEGLTSLSGGGWVTKETQEQKRIRNGCEGRVYDESCKGDPTTAIPGKSRHEYGTAIDFTCDARVIPDRSHECFEFLENNTKLKNLPSEPWHWSVDGG